MLISSALASRPRALARQHFGGPMKPDIMARTDVRVRSRVVRTSWLPRTLISQWRPVFVTGKCVMAGGHNASISYDLRCSSSLFSRFVKIMSCTQLFRVAQISLITRDDGREMHFLAARFIRRATLLLIIGDVHRWPSPRYKIIDSIIFRRRYSGLSAISTISSLWAYSC